MFGKRAKMTKKKRRWRWTTLRRSATQILQTGEACIILLFALELRIKIYVVRYSAYSIKNRVLSNLKEKHFNAAVKLYSAAVEAFPGNAFFKAGSASEGDADDDDVTDEIEKRAARLFNGLRVILIGKR